MPNLATQAQKPKEKKTKQPQANLKPRSTRATREGKLYVNREASYIEREWFPTAEAYHAELEVEERARQVVAEIEKLGIQAKAYPGDPYFITNLLVDQPDLVLNLVDTLRGKDYLQTTIPASLEMTDIPYTGAGIRGLVIGNDRNLFKQILMANSIPTPNYQFIRKRGTKVNPEVGLPMIVKLNESGGSVGIDNAAVRETLEEAQERVDELISTYKLPVIVEQFISGEEITAVVFDDGRRTHTFLGRKIFNVKPDGKHNFTSLESYEDPNAYTYEKVADKALAEKLERLTEQAFRFLRNRDYAKFDIRIDEKAGTPYYTDCNPNTAFGPSLGLPFMEVLNMYGISFEKVLASLLSKHARKLKKSL